MIDIPEARATLLEGNCHDIFMLCDIALDELEANRDRIAGLEYDVHILSALHDPLSGDWKKAIIPAPGDADLHHLLKECTEDIDDIGIQHNAREMLDRYLAAIEGDKPCR